MAEAKACRQFRSSHLVVVAFDFGTTYSGYAFSFRNEPLQVHTNQNWIAGSEKLISLKTPTCVLLCPDRQFHSFGYDAENKYSELAFDEEHLDWLFFRRFKMLLYKHKKLTRKTVIDDINGTSMPAMTIFAMSIRYLKEHFLAQLDNQYTGVKETDIQYVLTVPAIWDDSAKQFMREAAIEAGIDTTRLRLALEPEAASLWCLTLTDEAVVGLKESDTYMVVDLGGGTVDVSVHGMNSDGTLSELHKASGGPWGGSNVDNNYIDWLANMYGQRAVERFKAEEMAGYFDLLREFENNKRSVRFDVMDPLMFRISATLKEMSEEEEGEALSKRTEGRGVVIKRDRMKIDPSVVHRWFDGPVENTVRHIKGILSEPSMERVNTVLLVGGFAESKYVQEKIKHAINDKRLVIPNDSGLAVLKGAVRFGHDPNLISTRVMKYSYGIGMTMDFDSSIHPMFLMTLINGQQRVDNIFGKCVGAGETVKIGHETITQCIPNDMNASLVEVFYSPDPDPRYIIDPECARLGKLEVEHPDGDTLEDKEFEIIITFGESELKVRARIIETDEEFHTTIDCLE